MAARLNINKEKKKLVQELRSLAPKQADPNPIIKTELPFYGVKVGELRKLAGQWVREHKETNAGEVLDLCDALWNEKVREEMVLASVILQRHGGARDEITPDLIDSWRPLLDNWETTDQFGQAVIGLWVADDPRGRFKELSRLVRDKHPWSRRLGLVGCVGIARSDSAEQYWPKVSKLILKLADDREAAIPKSISWVLRTNLRSCRDQVAKFIDEYSDELPAIAVREVRNKLKSGKKAAPKC